MRTLRIFLIFAISIFYLGTIPNILQKKNSLDLDVVLVFVVWPMLLQVLIYLVATPYKIRKLRRIKEENEILILQIENAELKNKLKSLE